MSTGGAINERASRSKSSAQQVVLARGDTARESGVVSALAASRGGRAAAKSGKSKSELESEVSKLKEDIGELRKLLENEKRNCQRLLQDCSKLRAYLDQGRDRIKELETAGAAVAIGEAREHRTRSLEFDDNNRMVLGKATRDIVWRRHKITNRKSFDNGEIQRILHHELHDNFHSEESMAEHRDCLIRLVNQELSNKRTAVNKALLEAWKGKGSLYPWLLLYD